MRRVRCAVASSKQGGVGAKVAAPAQAAQLAATTWPGTEQLGHVFGAAIN